jgi:hypothetical protein
MTPAQNKCYFAKKPQCFDSLQLRSLHLKSKSASSPSRGRSAVLEPPPDLPGCTAAVPRASALPPASLSSYLQPSARIRAPSGCRALEPSSSFRPRAVDLALPALRPRAPSGLLPSSLRPPPPTSTPRPRALAPAGSSPRSSSYRLVPTL